MEGIIISPTNFLVKNGRDIFCIETDKTAPVPRYDGGTTDNVPEYCLISDYQWNEIEQNHLVQPLSPELEELCNKVINAHADMFESESQFVESHGYWPEKSSMNPDQKREKMIQLMDRLAAEYKAPEPFETVEIIDGPEIIEDGPIYEFKVSSGKNIELTFTTVKTQMRISSKHQIFLLVGISPYCQDFTGFYNTSTKSGKGVLANPRD
ncbi:MAG TPA: hypothetical protein PLK76_04195 [bacterium]|nr:hypothetical protein [bacterium]